MSRRQTATERFRRIVNVVPWIAERGPTTVAEACEHFGMSREDLLADLEVAFMVGIPPYTPDTLIDVHIDEASDEISIGFGAYFERPLSLSPIEGQRLLIAGRAMVNSLGDHDGPLGRAVAKLGAALGVDAEGALGISLGDASSELLAMLDRAVAERRSVDLRYYTFGSDTHIERRVDPLHLEARRGAWYLDAWCHTAGERRVFRVDRIERAELTDEHFDEPDDAAETDGTDAAPPTVVLEVDPREWVGVSASVISAEEVDEHRRRLELAVIGAAWLERVLLQLGDDATIVGGSLTGGGDAVEHWSSLRRDAATRVLRRYESP